MTIYELRVAMKKESGKTILYILLSLAVIALIVFGVLRLSQKQKTESNSVSETIQKLLPGSGQQTSDRKEKESPVL